MAFTEVLLFCLSPAPLDTGAKMPPADRRRPRKRREAAGGHRKHGQKKTRPRKAQGGRWRYSRFFRRLPDNHDRKSQNKQDNQAGVTSSRIMYLIGLLYRSRIPCASARRLQAAASSKVLYNALYGCHLWPRPPIPAYTRYFTAVSSVLRRAGQDRAALIVSPPGRAKSPILVSTRSRYARLFSRAYSVLIR